CVALAVTACLFLAGFVPAGEPAVALKTAQGAFDKADKDTLTIRPRGADGKFEKALVLRLTGTSKLTLVSQRKQAGKLVFVQTDANVKELESNQPIAVIYATAKEGPVLLSAVVQAAKGK